MKADKVLPILRVALLYALFSGLWILFSDRLVESLSHDPLIITRIQTYKGVAFVLASAGIIFILMFREMKRREDAWQTFDHDRNDFMEDLKRNNAELQRRAENLATINSLGQNLADTFDLEEIYIYLKEAIRELVPMVSGICLALYNNERQWLNCTYTNQEGEDETMTHNNPIPLDLPGYEAPREAIRARQPLLIHDLPTMPINFPSPENTLPPKAVLYVPMLSHETVVGLLQVQSCTPDYFSADKVELLTIAANAAGIAIQNALLVDQLQRSNLDLTQAYDATIAGWSRAMELRDRETEGHTQRVALLTVRLASKLGIQGEKLVHVRRGALLHDIGKMGIPDTILLKKGPLTHEERSIMQDHPTYAYQMIEPIAYLRPALDIPYCHHERWNGSGYPRGLRGEEIPLPARIFAVVDVWDALLSNRPYHVAWPIHKARDYIVQQEGILFDPAVVKVFLEIVGEDRQPKDAYRDSHQRTIAGRKDGNT